MPNRPAGSGDAHRAGERRYVAFVGTRLVAEGSVVEVARAARRALARSRDDTFLAFDALTSEPLELDLRGTEAEVVARARAAGGPAAGAAGGVARATADGTDEDDSGDARGPGRPRLGVVGREVTLLPRHWEWLNAQPGGASAALRRLVDVGRAANAGRDRTRRAQEYAYRFLAAMLGDAPGFEEATRALFAGDRERFTALSDPWPAGPRDHARRLADPAWPTS
ncbi:MAG: DUF2239 family protein [Gemmatimonadales bacterium]|nr:DUF2239 family protein [Gemmatimonadales bacterium]